MASRLRSDNASGAVDEPLVRAKIAGDHNAGQSRILVRNPLSSAVNMRSSSAKEWKAGPGRESSCCLFSWDHCSLLAQMRALLKLDPAQSGSIGSSPSVISIGIVRYEMRPRDDGFTPADPNSTSHPKKEREKKVRVPIIFIIILLLLSSCSGIKISGCWCCDSMTIKIPRVAPFQPQAVILGHLQAFHKWPNYF